MKNIQRENKYFIFFPSSIFYTVSLPLQSLIFIALSLLSQPLFALSHSLSALSKEYCFYRDDLFASYAFLNSKYSSDVDNVKSILALNIGSGLAYRDIALTEKERTHQYHWLNAGLTIKNQKKAPDRLNIEYYLHNNFSTIEVPSLFMEYTFQKVHASKNNLYQLSSSFSFFTHCLLDKTQGYKRFNIGCEHTISYLYALNAQSSALFTLSTNYLTSLQFTACI